MRYLVTARLKAGHSNKLVDAIDDGVLGKGSVAGGEYVRNMRQARLLDSGDIRWVEVCFCPTPLEEERPYWEEYFDLTQIKNAHGRQRCRDLNGEEPWACCDCDCTERLENKMAAWGRSFLKVLKGKK